MESGAQVPLNGSLLEAGPVSAQRKAWNSDCGILFKQHGGLKDDDKQHAVVVM